MDKLLRELKENCLPYLHDMVIFSDTWKNHTKYLETVLIRIREAKLEVKIAKCKFAQKTVKYLVHVVGEEQRKPAEAKIQAITELPAPKTKTEIRRCLDMAGYYSRYIKNYATVVEPLTRALKGKHRKGEIAWSYEMSKGLEPLKKETKRKPYSVRLK